MASFFVYTVKSGTRVALPERADMSNGELSPRSRRQGDLDEAIQLPSPDFSARRCGRCVYASARQELTQNCMCRGSIDQVVFRVEVDTHIEDHMTRYGERHPRLYDTE